MKKFFKHVQRGWSVVSGEVCIGPKPDGRVSTSGNGVPPAVRELTYDSGVDHHYRDSTSVSVREPSCATLKQHTSTSACLSTNAKEPKKLDKEMAVIVATVRKELKAAELKGFESFNPPQEDLEIFEVGIEKALRNKLRNEMEPGYFEEGSDGDDSKDSDYTENSGKRKRKKATNKKDQKQTAEKKNKSVYQKSKDIEASSVKRYHWKLFQNKINDSTNNYVLY